jgi:hypothetical protein
MPTLTSQSCHRHSGIRGYDLCPRVPRVRPRPMENIGRAGGGSRRRSERPRDGVVPGDGDAVAKVVIGRGIRG